MSKIFLIFALAKGKFMKQIDFLQDCAIVLATHEQGKKLYNREKSYVVSENGGEEIAECGRKYWVGEFTAKLWHRGTYRFKCKLEKWGDGKQYYSVEHKKVA